MKLLLSSDVTLSHAHDVTLGPDSRVHFHGLIVTLMIEYPAFEPADESTARGLWKVLLAEVTDKDLRDIPGIRPTFSSLALNLLERARSQVSANAVAVRIACPVDGWEVRSG